MTTAAAPQAAPTARHPVLRLWWLSPVVVTLFIAVAAIVPTALVSDQQFRNLWGSPKSITLETLALFGCGAIALAFGAMMAIAALPPVRGLPRPWPNLSDAAIRLLRRASTVLALATVVGYMGFVFLIAKAGLSLSDLFGGSSDEGSAQPVKDMIGTIPGLTTLTQLGIASVIVSAILLVHAYSRVELIKLLAVVGFAVPRAYIYSERLAILELIIPVGLIVAARFSNGRGIRKVVAQFVPPVSLVGVVVIFGTFEYFRSWNFYRTHSTQSFTEFALSRFAGYYTTALNNGQLIMDHLSWPNRLPFDTLEGVWTAPGIEQFGLYEKLSGHARPYTREATDSLYFDVLRQYANPEFNNSSGYGGVFVDYGWIGGLIFFVVAGLLAGFLYGRFCQARSVGLLLYPMFFVGLVELPRYVYWVQGRATYAWIALVILVVLMKRVEVRDGRGKKWAITPAVQSSS